MHKSQEVQEIVKSYIGNFVGLDSVGEEVNIFEEGLVNSLFAIELMTFLEKSFDIKIGMDDLNMAYFTSINTITAFVAKKEVEKVG